MDKAEHAERLRRAIDERGIPRRDIASAVGRDYRTVTNWVSRKSPTMPSAAERAVLRHILGDYDNPGDPVEVALDSSELIEWRRDAVKSFYKRNLHEQREERGA